MPVAYDDVRVIRPNLQWEYTKEQLSEYVKCAKSVEYFALNYARAIHPVRGVIPLDFRSYQVELLNNLQNNKKNVGLLPRQSGKSLIVSVYMLWLATFTDKPQNLFILANKGEQARSLLSNMKIMYEELPPWLKKGVIEYAKTMVKFEDNTMIKTAGTTSDAIRGQSISFLLLDEFAFVPNHIAQEFYTAVQPTISTGGSIAIISTPNGASGLFYELFTNAKANGRNGYKSFTINWDDVPGRDEKFRDEMIKDIGLVKFNQEYGMSFIGSSLTLLSGKALETLVQQKDDPIKEINGLKYYESAHPGRFYVAGVDVAKGVGGDYSCIQIVDITERGKYKLVATYADNFIRPEQLVLKIIEVAREFNNAFVIVENNTFGYAICQSLWNEHFYENLYREPKKLEHGISANVRSKTISTSSLKKLVEENQLFISDKKTIDELHGFIEIRDNVYGCEEGENNHDDHVMALVWACYFTDTSYWVDQETYLLNKPTEDNINKVEREMFDPIDMETIHRKLGDDSGSEGWL
jgi:hypothetical protein